LSNALELRRFQPRRGAQSILSQVYMPPVILSTTPFLDPGRVEKSPTLLSTRLDSQHRIEFMMGKMGLVDFFDNNGVGSDSHLQFTNWPSITMALTITLPTHVAIPSLRFSVMPDRNSKSATRKH